MSTSTRNINLTSIWNILDSISDFVIKRVLWVLTGTQSGCNQWVGELEPERLGRAYVFLNKVSIAFAVQDSTNLLSVVISLIKPCPT